MDRHDTDRRENFTGVTAADLDADKQIWSEIGAMVAAVARRLTDGCRASGFFAGKPDPATVCARLVESIDDQVDIPAWRLIEAAARARLEQP